MVPLAFQFYVRWALTHFVGVLTDHAAGMYATDIIYDDNDAEQLAKLPPEQPHRDVDLAVIAADEEGESHRPDIYGTSRTH